MATSESKGRFFLQNESIRITNRFDSHNESIRIANWNALLCTMMLHTSVGSLKFVCSLGYISLFVCLFGVDLRFCVYWSYPDTYPVLGIPHSVINVFFGLWMLAA